MISHHLGIWDTRDCAHCTGCVKGAPVPFANEIPYICCGYDCPVIYNECMSCYFPAVCGERVRMLPFETYCCCFTTRATACTNCFGLYGVKTGSPTMLFPFLSCLAKGHAEALTFALLESRGIWAARAGKQ